MNRKKNIYIENICFVGALWKMHLLLQFHRYNKIYNFISFTKTRRRAQKFQFFNFLKNKMRENVKNLIFKILHLFFVFFFNWKQMENVKTKIYAV